MFGRRTLSSLRFAILCFLAAVALPSFSQDAIPVFAVTPEDSKITFYVKASVDLEGTFDKWDAIMTFTSPDVTTGVLDIKIQADSVNTGSGMKDGKLKSKDFFDVYAGSVDHLSLRQGCPDRSQHVGHSGNLYHSRSLETRDADFYHHRKRDRLRRDQRNHGLRP